MAQVFLALFILLVCLGETLGPWQNGTAISALGLQNLQ
jgi:hypothetical protein